MAHQRDPLHPPLRVLDCSRRFWSQFSLPQWFAEYGRVVVGVSGGADSMALLYLMAGPFERPAWAPEVLAAHINHGLRGAESDADQERVARLCGILGLGFYYRRLDGEQLRARGGGSLEQTARHARYAALKSIMEETRAEALVLAHHQDDLAETFLLRLLRGSGLTGLGGFGPEAEVEGMPIIRPLIDWSRAELRQLARDAGIDWSEDATNRDVALMRNRIRHRVLPYLNRITDHPPVARMLARTARRLEREGKALDAIIKKVYGENRLERTDPRRVGIAREVLLRDDALFAPYLVRMLVCDVLQSFYPPSEEHTNSLLEFALSAQPNALHQSERNVVAWISSEDALCVYRKPTLKISRTYPLETFQKP